MLSRRGGSSSNNPWNTDAEFSMNMLNGTKELFIVGFVFDVLTMVVLILGIVWACMIRSQRVPLRGVISSLVAWLISTILIIIYEIFFLAEASIPEYYLIDLFMANFFSVVSNCLIIFVFYNLTHAFLDRLTDAGKPYAVVTTIHWVILGLVSALSIATWAAYVADQVVFVIDRLSFNNMLDEIYFKAESTMDIVFCIVSLEILAWAIFVTVKTRRPASTLPAVFLVIGSVFLVACNLMWAVINILYTLEKLPLPTYLETVESTCQFFFCVGIYVGILLCYKNCHNLGNREDKPAQLAQHPYGVAPAGYQEYQPYPQYLQQPQPFEVHGEQLEAYEVHGQPSQRYEVHGQPKQE